VRPDAPAAYQNAIIESFKSIAVNESAVRSWFAESGWMTWTRGTVEGREILDCQPSVWSPGRLEAVGCKKLDIYENLGVVRYQCPTDDERVMVRLIRDRAHCERFQGLLDRRTANLPER
jgi:hypothetical protein